MRFGVSLVLTLATLALGAATYATYRQKHDECWHGRTIGSFLACGDTLVAMGLRHKGETR
jgi:hypothetical protein